MPLVLHIKLRLPHISWVELQTLWQAALSVGHALSASKGGGSASLGVQGVGMRVRVNDHELAALGDDKQSDKVDR